MHYLLRNDSTVESRISYMDNHSIRWTYKRSWVYHGGKKECKKTMWIVQFQYVICLPVYLLHVFRIALKQFVNALMPTSVPHDDERWPRLKCYPDRQLGMLNGIQRWYMIYRTTIGQKGMPTSHNLTKWYDVIWASPGDMKGSKCQKGIHVNRFKVTLPPYTSETTRLCHFHRRWRHRTCPCESGSKNWSPAAQTANREAYIQMNI